MLEREEQGGRDSKCFLFLPTFKTTGHQRQGRHAGVGWATVQGGDRGRGGVRVQDGVRGRVVMGEATHSTARTHAQSNENKRAHIRKCGPVDGDEAGDGEGEIRRGRVSFVGAPKPSHGHSARMSPPWRAMPHRIARRHSLGPHHIPRPSFIFFVSPAVPSGRPACLHAVFLTRPSQPSPPPRRLPRPRRPPPPPPSPGPPPPRPPSPPRPR